MPAVAVVVRGSFLASAIELPKDIAKKVFKTLHLFMRDRQHPGLHVEKLGGQASGMWSLRVDDDYRIIFQETEGAPILLAVGKHEEVYRTAAAAAQSMAFMVTAARPRPEEPVQAETRFEALEPPEELPSLSPTVRRASLSTPETHTPVRLDAVETVVRTKKYLPLATRLLYEKGNSLQLSFPKIENLLMTPLPTAARKHRAWWANHGGRHVQGSAWLSVGWRVDAVDLASEQVSFKRADAD